MRWRIWLTRQFLGEWLDNRSTTGSSSTTLGTDNPDQRIAEDLRLFTSGTLDARAGAALVESSPLVSFVAILWAVSGPLDVPSDRRR